MTEAEPIPKRPLDKLDLAIASAVFVIGLVVWFLVPAEWSPIHAGGKWFLLVFAATSALAALLASRAVREGVRLKENPAVLMGVQVLFWNPLAYRAVLGLVESVGLPGGYGSVLALAGLLLLGLTTSLYGAAMSRSPAWIAANLSRALQCFFATWMPLFPPLFYLHVLLIAQVLNWDKNTRMNHAACALLLIEQSAAIAWVILFYQAPPA